MKRLGEKSETIIFLIWGFICHGWVMFNHYQATYSGLNQFVALYDMQISEGRWFSAVITKLNGDVCLPWITGLESMAMILVSIHFILKIYDIKKQELRLLIGIIIMSSPILQDDFVFVHVGEAFSAAMLLATIGVYVLVKTEYKYKYLLGVGILTLAVGAYQIYIGYAAMLILIYEIEGLSRNKNIDAIIRESVCCAITSFMSMVIYTFINKFVCFCTGIQQRNVMAFPKEFLNMLRAIKKCYYSFVDVMVSDTIYANMLPRIILVLNVVLLFYFFFISIYKEKDRNIRLLAFSIMLLIIPLLSFFIHLIDMGRTYNGLNRMAVPVVPLLFSTCVLGDGFGEKTTAVFSMQRIGHIGKKKYVINEVVLVCASMAILSWYQMICVNTSYMRMHNAYEKEYSLALRIVDCIEMQEDYTPGVPVYIIGGSEDVYNGYLRDSMFSEYPNHVGGSMYIMKDSLGVADFIKLYISTDMNIKRGKLPNLSNDVIDSMPSFPCKGCVMRFEQGYVIKLN